MNKIETTNGQRSTTWFATYNNIDLTVAKEYLEAWHTKHKAVYAVGQIEKGE